jgi:hypothetical protein
LPLLPCSMTLCARSLEVDGETTTSAHRLQRVPPGV